MPCAAEQRVVLGPANQVIIAILAQQDIVPRPALQPVRFCAAVQAVIADIPEQRIRPGPAKEGVIPRITAQAVIVRPAVQQVVLRAAEQGVPADPAVEQVVPGIAGQPVIPAAARNRCPAMQRVIATATRQDVVAFASEPQFRIVRAGEFHL